MHISYNQALNMLKSSRIRLSSSRSHKLFYHLKKCIKENMVAKVIKSEHLSHLANLSWVEKPDILTEGVFENCVEAYLFFHLGKIACEITLHDGDYYGDPVRANCCFLVHIETIDSEIEQIFMSTLEQRAEYEVQKEDDELLKRRIENKMKELLEKAK